MLDRCNATVHGRVVLLATPDSGHYAMAQLLTACQLSTTTGALRPASHLSSSQTAVHRADHTHHCITTRITAECSSSPARPDQRHRSSVTLLHRDQQHFVDRACHPARAAGGGCGRLHLLGRRVPHSCARVLSAPELRRGPLTAQPVPTNARGRQLLSSIVINNTLLIEPVTQRGARVAAVADCTSWGDECHTLARGVMVSRTLC